MATVRVLALVFALWILPLCAGAEEQMPDFGLMFNSDGDLSFTSMDPGQSAQNLRVMVDSLVGTPVKTLMYSVGAGSDVLYYPTKVASEWGWRTTRYDAEKAWKERIAKIKAGMAAGVDPIRVAGEQAKKRGMLFVPSYRMNDAHFMSNPTEYPLTGEFWMQTHPKFILGQSPVRGNPHYANLLDFSQSEVREYRLGVISEVIDRYQDILDGVELDFTRTAILFPPGKGQERGSLVTEMIEKVRQKLDEARRKQARPLCLFVRVPPALKNCRWAGLQVEEWAKKRLVHAIIPAQLMTLAHDMPVDEFVALAKPAGIKVYPGVYPRTSWTWPFVSAPTAQSYSGPASRTVSPELLRGAASNYWHMGAAGFQLFNFGLPPDEWMYRTMRDLADPAALTAQDKVYAITPAYYLDSEDTYEYRKQIPLALTAGTEHVLALCVGDNLNDRGLAPACSGCVLRLGLTAVSNATDLAITLNGEALHAGPLGDKLILVGKGRPANPRSSPPAATSFVHLPVRDLRMLKQGANALTVNCKALAEESKATLMQAELGVFYDRNYSKMLTE